MTGARRGEDLLPGPALAVAGGALGRHASARAWSRAAVLVPALLLGGATMGVAVLERAHCIRVGWDGTDQFWHACFSDLPPLYQLGNLHAGLGAYVGGGAEVTRVDHPVLTGAVMSFLGGLVPRGGVLEQTRWYFLFWAVLATALVLTVVWLTSASRPRHRVDALQVALSPLLVVAALVSADVVGVALVSAGIWAWSRRWPAVAGALLGLAVTARTYPLLVLLALLLLGLRTGRLRPAGRAVGAAALACVVVLVPFLMGNRAAIARPYRAWWDSGAGLGSPWMLPQLFGHPLPSGLVTLLAVVGMLLAVLAGAVLALGTARRPTLAELALVLVAVVLVTGKSFPVQASLWLLPLAALCGIRWRDHLLWAAAEGLHFVTVWLYVAGQSVPDRGLPPHWYAVFLLLRVAAVGYLAWRVWRTAAQRPEAPETREVGDVGDVGEVGDTAWLQSSDVLTGGHSRSDVLTGQDRLESPKTVRDGAEDRLESPKTAREDAEGELEPDPDSDAVVDELAGPFTDAPDYLVVAFR